jgi:hypothetical protein
MRRCTAGVVGAPPGVRTSINPPWGARRSIVIGVWRDVELDRTRHPLRRWILVEATHVLSCGRQSYDVPMARDWIDQGLRQMREREEQQRLASKRRHDQAAVIKEKGPDLMRRLVAEVGAVVAEYRQKAPPGSNEIELETLPHEGFCITRSTLPKVALECRPGYETHAVYCNMTRIGDSESDAQEFVFSLGMTVDESDRIALCHETVAFPSVGEVVKFLLKPVLFPTLDSDL